MILAPVDLLSAHPWRRIAFTTYALSLSFFEAVILDLLVRSGAVSEAVILADVNGVRECLSEQGAQRVGKDYELEPMAVSRGVFHPKISVLWSPDECHMLVGSGNLTFNGWGGNYEIVEHLHPGFAADAFDDAADFFELLAASDRVRHGAANRCGAIAADLRQAVQGRPRNKDIRLLHSMNTSIADQIAQIAGDLGGARRLVVAAPFWDGGTALDQMCNAIGVREAFIHSHGKGTVQGGGLNWPRNALTAVRAVRLAIMDGPDANRPLHAKAYEILCRHGRIIISGSANCSTYALGTGNNVEACVMRVQRERSAGWTFTAAQPPDPQGEPATEDEDEATRTGVLRAVLDADELIGQVLTPKIRGPVTVYYVAGTGPELLDRTTIGPEGSFRITAPILESMSWRGGRVVIRVMDSQSRKADGFVSVASFAEIMRRGGIVARRLLALVSGDETPEDVAAIFNWFYEDPQRLVPDARDIRGGGAEATDVSDRLVPVAALRTSYGDMFAAATTHEGPPSRNWSRFIDQVLLAFREPRGPLRGMYSATSGDDEDKNGSNERQPDDEDKAGTSKAFAVFERLFAVLTKDGAPVRNSMIAFQLTGYICDRLRPEPMQALAWLDRIVKVLLKDHLAPESRDNLAAAILTRLGAEPTLSLCRWARTSLLSIGVDLTGPPPPAEALQGYQAVLLQQEGYPELWERVRMVRTIAEQRRCYLEALRNGQPSPEDYPDLPSEAREEWPVLEAALTSAHERLKVLVANEATETCPVHYMSLPAAETHKLRSTGIATTKNCCCKILIWQGT